MKRICLVILFITFFLTIQLNAQITIGGSTTPNKGALLDLKEFEDDQAKQGGRTANKGFMLPRVHLTHQNELRPMYSYLDENSRPHPNDLSLHTGLIVFNMNKCKPFGKGVYMWNGSEWIGIHPKPHLPSPDETIELGVLHIPSGMDARPSAKQDITFRWEGTSPTFTDPQAHTHQGLIFTSPRGLTPSSKNWTSSPATLSVWADDMTSDVINNNLWTTRQSKITVTIPANDCGTEFTKEVILNQTNYAMILDPTNTALSGDKEIMIRDTKSQKIKILSNVPWKATATAGQGSQISDILASYTTEVKDEESSNGITGNDDDFTYQGVAITNAAKRYASATLTFKDQTNKAKDLVVSVKQCRGIPAMNNVYPETSTENTTNGNSAWGNRVVRHPQKDGVYKEFYSATFGGAGRWMITNLAAEQYDGISHSAGRTLTKEANTSEANNTAFWAYPNQTEASLTDATEYNNNPFLGYLYTWDAATGGKGGTYGDENRDKAASGWQVDRSEVGMLEWTGDKEATNRGKTQLRRQGVCPKGWHLPSDYEWTQLEQEIILHTEKYASMANILSMDPPSPNPDENKKVEQYTPIDGPDGGTGIPIKYTDAWRGSTHGQAMKDLCEPNYTGKSKHPDQNGFNVLLAGYGLDGEPGGFGQDAMFWTSSVAHSKGAYARIFTKSKNAVYFYKPFRYHQFSVRCKKD